MSIAAPKTALELTPSAAPATRPAVQVAPPGKAAILRKSARELGLRWVAYRLGHAWDRISGALERRFPLQQWEDRPLEQWLRPGIPSEAIAYAAWRRDHAGKFFTDAHALSQHVSPSATIMADNVLAGTFPYFGRTQQMGFPPAWSSGQDFHFSRIDEFAGGDIKVAWEPNRFASAFYLARAFAATGDDRYAEGYWALVEDWAEKNPPNRGVNWKCGQEASLRTMALCFGLYLTAGARATTPARVARLAAILAFHGDRIARHIGYARSQKNNHSISEATGLLTIACLFPELAPSHAWRETALAVLAADVAEQFYADGSYVQHSFNYERLALQDLLWAGCVARSNGLELPDAVGSALRRASEFLAGIVDPRTGAVPNFGANDGSLILPLTGCEYGDFRPVLQSSYFASHGARLLPPGPWDEEAATLFGRDALEAPQRERPLGSWSAESGGLYFLRGAESWAMARCARFRHRPGHADQLHLDLWWRGVNVLCDAGTFSYNARAPFESGLKNTRFHNTVSVAGRDAMTEASRFLWLDWAHGTVRRFHRGSRIDLIEMEHAGYRKLGVKHRRCVIRVADRFWVVVDDILGNGEPSARLHWLAADAPFTFRPHECRLDIDSPAGAVSLCVLAPGGALADLVRAGNRVGVASTSECAERGWVSHRYMEAVPALSFSVEAVAPLPLRFVTVISLGGRADAQLASNSLRVASGEVTICLELSVCGDEDIVRSADLLHGDDLVEHCDGRPERKFLLIHQAFAAKNDPGGTRHFELAKRVAESGHRFTVIASDVNYATGVRVTAKPALFTGSQEEGVEVVRAYTLTTLHKSFVWRVAAFFSFMATSFLASLRSGKVDVVMGTTPPIFQAATAWLVALLRRKPFLLEVRDLWPEFAIDIGVLTNPVLIAMSRWLEMFLYRRATHILVNSPAYRDYIAAKGIAREKISLVANGVDSSMFDPDARGGEFRAKIGAGERFVVTYAGAMGLANDLGVVLEAAARLRDRDDIVFALVGDGKERAALHRQAESLGLRNVVFTGAVPKASMPSVLAGSDACIAVLKNIPMFTTTYPNKVFDYMAAGRPTLLAIAGVICEVVEAAEAGIAVPPGDAEAMAAAVLTLADNRPLARRMGRNGRAYVVEHFNRDEQALRFEELLVRLAEPGR